MALFYSPLDTQMHITAMFSRLFLRHQPSSLESDNYPISRCEQYHLECVHTRRTTNRSFACIVYWIECIEIISLLSLPTFTTTTTTSSLLPLTLYISTPPLSTLQTHHHLILCVCTAINSPIPPLFSAAISSRRPRLQSITLIYAVGYELFHFHMRSEHAAREARGRQRRRRSAPTWRFTAVENKKVHSDTNVVVAGTRGDMSYRWV